MRLRKNILSVILLGCLITASCIFAQPLEDRLAVESRLPVYLNADKAIIVFERQKASDSMQLNLSFLEQNTGKVPTEPIEINLSGESKGYVHNIDISSWQDGEYKMFVQISGQDDQEPLVRGIIKQTLQEPTPPQGIIDMTGIKMFFADDWYLQNESGIHRQVHPAEYIPIAPWETNEDYYFFRNSLRQYWFDVDGALNVRLFGSNTRTDEPVDYWAKSDDFVSWQIVDQPTRRAADCTITNLRDAPPGLRTDVEPRYRYYDEEKDGEVDLSQVRVVWSGTERNVKWGDYDIPYRARIAVWEKPDGLRVILGDPITKDKSVFADDEIGNWTDTNDNFGDLRFSADGKTLRCYQSRLLPAHDPFRVHYDNIMTNRIMVTWSSSDGLNWTPTLFNAPTLDDPWSTQHYGVDIWTQEDRRLEFAYHRIYDVQLQRVYTELVYSRDGVYWNRFDDGKPFLDNGAPGDWNFGYSMTTGNRTRMSYNGHYYEPMQGINVLHFMFMIANYRDRSLVNEELFRERFDGKMMGDNGFQYSPIMNWYDSVEDVIKHTKEQMFTPALMKYRKDGWVSASPQKRRATMTTKPFSSNSSELIINAKTKPDGFVMIEVLDYAANPIAKYSGTNAAVFTGDETAAKLLFANGEIESLPEEPYHLKITLENAEVYTLKF